MSQIQIQTLRALFKNVPQVVDPIKLNNITDKSFLMELETQYEKFLEANLQLLDLHNLIDDLLNIRDAILMKLQRMNRQEQLRRYYEGLESKAPNSHLTTPRVNIQYYCGCQKIIINDKHCHHHCDNHFSLIQKKHLLVDELTNIEIELKNITHETNINYVNY
jgi:hypothetical protein